MNLQGKPAQTFSELLEMARELNNSLCDMVPKHEAGSNEEKLLHSLYNMGTIFQLMDQYNDKLDINTSEIEKRYLINMSDPLPTKNTANNG